jgi:hypothetical protein
MHPAMALWVWSISISRIWQDSFAGCENLPDMRQSQLEDKQLESIAAAQPCLKSGETEDALPDIILDRLAHLYWIEREPALAI